MTGLCYFNLPPTPPKTKTHTHTFIPNLHHKKQYLCITKNWDWISSGIVLLSLVRRIWPSDLCNLPLSWRHLIEVTETVQNQLELENEHLDFLSSQNRSPRNHSLIGVPLICLLSSDSLIYQPTDQVLSILGIRYLSSSFEPTRRSLWGQAFSFLVFSFLNFKIKKIRILSTLT